jgi:hypothetical protein
MLRAAGGGATPRLLAASAVAVSVTGTTNETALATVTIPAGAMGLNGGLWIYSTWSYPNSANNKTPRIRFGGAAGTQYHALAQSTTVSYQGFVRIRNRNSASSQIGGSSIFTSIGQTSTVAPPTSALDTSVAQDIVFSGQLGLSTETLTLESYEVWLVP